MKIVRILFTVFLLLAALPASAKVDWTDVWYDPAEPGWGINLVQSDTFMYGTFYIFDAAGKPTWYAAQMTWDQARLEFVGPLYLPAGTGYQFPWRQGDVSVTQVGTASFKPTQGGISVSYKGTLRYTFTDTGFTVTKPVERITLTRIDLGGSFTGGQYGEYYDCPSSADNYTYTDPFDLEVTHDGSSLRMDFTYRSGTCTLAGTLEQHGSLYRINGASYRCSNGLNTTATVYDLKSGSLGIEGRLYASSVGAGCKEAAKFAGVYATGQAAQ